MTATTMSRFIKVHAGVGGEQLEADAVQVRGRDPRRCLVGGGADGEHLGAR